MLNYFNKEKERVETIDGNIELYIGKNSNKIQKITFPNCNHWDSEKIINFLQRSLLPSDESKEIISEIIKSKNINDHIKKEISKIHKE